MSRRPSQNKSQSARQPRSEPRPKLELPRAPYPIAPPPEFGAMCGEFGLQVDPSEIDSLGRFLGLLLETNKVMNLTGIKEPADAWIKHIFDSLTPMGVLSELVQQSDGSKPFTIADVGAGGGLPSIPLAIAMPEVRFTLIEATGKKCDFLRHAVNELGLRNVRVLSSRAEGAGRAKGVRDSFDAAVCRALGRMAVAAELVTPVVRLGGVAIFIKGERAAEELDEAARGIEMLGCSHAGTFETPTGRLVVLEKERGTPGAYPRQDGMPKQAPLGVR